MSIADMLAKKKAALAASIPAPAPAPVQAPAPVPAKPIPTEPVKPVEAAKPMTFAEKLAAKKAAQAAPAPAQTLSIQNDLPELEVLSAPVTAASLPVKASGPIPILSENPSTQQAYADLRMKIDDLQTRMGDDLKSAMSQLKASLMSNPAACEIMLDEDVGNMVIALLRMTMQEVVGAKETGKKTKKIKDLTAEELLAGIDEL